MKLLKEIRRSLQITFVLWLLTVIIYPSILLLIGHFIFPFQANGSLLQDTEGNILGSELIGQPFESDRYFWGRPSAVNYATNLADRRTGISGASHLAPSNPALRDRIAATAQRLQAAGLNFIPSDLLYSSGSGLDPHISIAAAQVQVARVAQARQRSPQSITALLNCHRNRPIFGLIGGTDINVLKLNLALDQPEAKLLRHCLAKHS